MKVCIIAFNIGSSNGFVNGPGMSLRNFVKFLKKYENCDISIYTQLKTSDVIDGILVSDIRSSYDLKERILESDIIHCWSGMTDEIYNLIFFAKSNNKKIFLGPNLIDTVDVPRERKLLKTISPNGLFVVNSKIKHSAVSLYGLNENTVKEIVVGPDTELWKPPAEYNDVILWKGNSKHKVKDVEFGIKVAKKLNKYNFLFLGHPHPYNYSDHVNIARKSYLYFTTSISETKGMAVLEQWAAGVPAVTHSKIYQSGINYKTGIIAKRNINAYCEAIEEMVEDRVLRDEMSRFSAKYVKEHYDPEKLIRNIVRYYSHE